MRRVRYMPSMIAVLIALAFVSLGLFRGLQGGGNVHPICGELATLDEDVVPIIIRGEFLTYHENLAYVGEVIPFELTVIYDTNTVVVHDEALQEFDVSPFTLRSQSASVTEERRGFCILKRTRFDLQVFGVQTGLLNRFQFTNDDGYPFAPTLSYSVEGTQRSMSPDYAPLFVGSLTGGWPVPPRGIPDVSVEPPLAQSSSPPLFVLWQAVGAIGILAFVVMFELFFSRYQKSQRLKKAVKPDILCKEFPGLFREDNPLDSLTSVFFDLDYWVEHLGSEHRFALTCLALRESARIVFSSDEMKEETCREVLSTIRQRLEQYRYVFEGGV